MKNMVESASELVTVAMATSYRRLGKPLKSLGMGGIQLSDWTCTL